MSAPVFEAQMPTGVAAELILQVDDGIPKDPICEHKLPSGVPLDAHARVVEVLEYVSGEWKVRDTEPHYERTMSAESPSTLFDRLKEMIAWRKRRRLEQSVGRTTLRALDATMHYSLPLSRLA